MNRNLTRPAALLLLAGALAAPGGALEPGRFDVNGEPVWVVDDTTKVPLPSATAWNRNRAYVDDQWLRPMDDLLALRGSGRARDLNCWDEVPASTWFTPGGDAVPAPYRSLFAAMRQAPPSVRLDHSGPLQVLDARVDGPDPYLVVRDARGARYWLDFDEPTAPEQRTAAAVAASRLLRLAGYPVLDCGIDAITPGELELAPRAILTGEFWSSSDLRAADLDRFLGRRSGGRREAKIRVAASRLPEGIALGSFPERGVRGDDPNDRIPHQERRSLRGLRILASWIDYAAWREDRTLDVWLQPEGFVRHYIRGLTRTLGAGPSAAAAGEPGTPAGAFGSLPSTEFDPLQWTTVDPCAPFTAIGWGDALWGVRQLLMIAPEQIRAAVKAAGLTDPEREAILTGTLIERREQIARAWLERVNGAEGFAVREVAPGRWVLEAQDLGVRTGLRLPEDVTFAMRLRLPDAKETWGFQSRGGDHAAFDLGPFLPAAWLHRFDARRYAIAEVRSWDYRGRELEGTARVHLYFDRDTGPRIVGIERD
jgi:hypothetical protein